MCELYSPRGGSRPKSDSGYNWPRFYFAATHYGISEWNFWLMTLSQLDALMEGEMDSQPKRSGDPLHSPRVPKRVSREESTAALKRLGGMVPH